MYIKKYIFATPASIQSTETTLIYSFPLFQKHSGNIKR